MIWSSRTCLTGSPGAAWDHQGAYQLPSHVRQYWWVRVKLRLVEGVLVVEDRTVLPTKLRRLVPETPHSAHQGVLAMGVRAKQAVNWPGFWSDIERMRAKCSTCQKIAPSQAKLPPVETLVPNYPFKHVCVDYMSLNGNEFGVFVDRHTEAGRVCKGAPRLRRSWQSCARTTACQSVAHLMRALTSHRSAWRRC